MMPNLIGLELSEAQATLQAAGVLNPDSLGYFGAWPISVQWVSADSVPLFFTADSSVTADSSITVDDYFLSLLTFPGSIVNQSLGAGTSVSQNALLQLTAVQYPISVAYP